MITNHEIRVINLVINSLRKPKGQAMNREEYMDHCDQAKDDYEDEMATAEREAEEAAESTL